MKRLLLLALTAAVAWGQYYPPGGGTGGTTVNVNGASVTAPNFNATTPSATAGNQNASLQVSGSSVSIQIPLPFSTCSTTILYTDTIFHTASTSATKTACAIPANSMILHYRIKHSIKWEGTGVTAGYPTVSLGTTGAGHETDYALAFALDAVVGTTAMRDSPSITYDSGAHNIVAWFTANTNFGNGAATVLTAGSVTITVVYLAIP